jgi:Cornichon protein
LAWLLSFVLQSALVGIVFYTLIQLYDFEEDLLNNSDCAKRCNMWVVSSLSSADVSRNTSLHSRLVSVLRI